MKKVSGRQVVTAVGAAGSPLPPQIQEVLGELVGAAREGLLALSVGVGLGVVHELMELEGQARPWSSRQAPRSRGWVDDIGWPACEGQPAACANRR